MDKKLSPIHCGRAKVASAASFWRISRSFLAPRQPPSQTRSPSPSCLRVRCVPHGGREHVLEHVPPFPSIHRADANANNTCVHRCREQPHHLPNCKHSSSPPRSPLTQTQSASPQ